MYQLQVESFQRKISYTTRFNNAAIFVDQMDYTMRVPFTDQDHAQIEAVAQQKYLRWHKTNEKNPSPYMINSYHAQVIGSAGEFATYKLMQDFVKLVALKYKRYMKIDPAFMDDHREGECDLIVNGLRCEVKTLIWKDWVNYGPCITAAQRPRIEAKADVIIWVVHNKARRVGAVMGFTPVSEIASVPAAYTGIGDRKIFNHTLRNHVYDLNTDMFLDYAHYLTELHEYNRIIDVPREDTTTTVVKREKEVA